jgi:hypothetical protein
MLTLSTIIGQLSLSLLFIVPLTIGQIGFQVITSADEVIITSEQFQCMQDFFNGHFIADLYKYTHLNMNGFENLKTATSGDRMNKL